MKSLSTLAFQKKVLVILNMVRKEILRHHAVGQTWNKSVGQTQRHRIQKGLNCPMNSSNTPISPTFGGTGIRTSSWIRPSKLGVSLEYDYCCGDITQGVN